LVHVIDSGHETMIVPHHLVAAEEESEGESEQEDSSGAAQEPGFEASFQSKDVRVELSSPAELGEPVAKLPSAGGHPISEGADDGEGEHETAELGVKWQIEEIE